VFSLVNKLLLRRLAGSPPYVSPPLESHLFPFIAAASALAELPLQLWLIVVGVNDRRWKEQASASLRDM
jgi:hypothetical protein